jgi:hypothetical protein
VRGCRRLEEDRDQERGGRDGGHDAAPEHAAASVEAADQVYPEKVLPEH